MESQPPLPPLSVFTKPWKTLPIDDLVFLIERLGFNGVELPVRTGFQVSPESIKGELPKAANLFRKSGLNIYSIAADLSQEAVEACADSGVGMIRVMLPVARGASYKESVEAFREQCRNLYPLLRNCEVKIGLQNHCDDFVGSSIGVLHAIEPLDEDCVSTVLDLGHTGLDGEGEEMAIDIAWPRLERVNLKNALRYELARDQEGTVEWGRTWVPGRKGITSWPRAVAELVRRAYAGPICLTAEYKNDDFISLEGDEVIPSLQDDMDFLRNLWSRKS